MAESIDAVFTITRSEYVRAMRRYYMTKFNVVRDSLIGVAAIGLGWYYLSIPGDSFFGWLPIAAGVAMLGMQVYIVTLLPGLHYRYEPKLKSEYRLQFRDEGLRFQTDDIDSELKWSLYNSWKRDDEFFYLFHGKRNVSVIPRRALVDADEKLAAMLQRQIGAAVS
jgi:hypothetical protein